MTSSDSSPFPVRLNALQWGRADARPRALLLHGLSSAAGSWWQVASALAAAGWSVTAPDLRGHGASPRTVRYRLDDYAADVLELAPTPAAAAAPTAAATLPDRQPWDLVVGHSLGGAIATVAAEADPDWTRALLLLDPVLSLSEERHDQTLAGILGGLEVLDPAQILQANPRWQLEDAVQKVNAARVTSPFVVERSVRDNGGWDLEPVVARIPSRVHILAADPQLGASFTAAEGGRLTALAETISFATVDGSGHSIQRDDPDRVIAEALALIAP